MYMKLVYVNPRNGKKKKERKQKARNYVRKRFHCNLNVIRQHIANVTALYLLSDVSKSSPRYNITHATYGSISYAPDLHDTVSVPTRRFGRRIFRISFTRQQTTRRPTGGSGARSVQFWIFLPVIALLFCFISGQFRVCCTIFPFLLKLPVVTDVYLC